MKNKKETFIRINSRIRNDQFLFVKKLAKEKKFGEGEAHRFILDEFMLRFAGVTKEKNG